MCSLASIAPSSNDWCSSVGQQQNFQYLVSSPTVTPAFDTTVQGYASSWPRQWSWSWYSSQPVGCLLSSTNSRWPIPTLWYYCLHGSRPYHWRNRRFNPQWNLRLPLRWSTFFRLSLHWSKYLHSRSLNVLLHSARYRYGCRWCGWAPFGDPCRSVGDLGVV